ncbi:hypothetical protein ONZ45_g13911 [Pleurotus djamor]|nr:hypothetical protein ONZ45_g13911 [Pleurotus djamor]
MENSAKMHPAAAGLPIHAFSGDYYAGNQLGGNIGGHNNHNSIVNQGDENLRTTIEGIDARLKSGTMNDCQVYEALGKLARALKECKELLELGEKAKSSLREKVGFPA